MAMRDTGGPSVTRCKWARGDDLYEQYHDQEWGVPCYDDGKLFEFLILESAQAGLSWLTILRKRDNYRQAFANYFWGFLDGKPLPNRWRSTADVPATTALSDTISMDMKKRGFRFFGSTICYAHMQAMGMVNDHTLDCFRHGECAALART